MYRLSLIRAAALVVAALAAPAALHAQSTTTPKVFSACYVPSSGSVYRIKEADLKQECIKSTHVQFSWTDGAGSLTDVFTVESSDEIVPPGSTGSGGVLCPAGSRVVGGGHLLVAYDRAKRPAVEYSIPHVSAAGWMVALYNPTDAATMLSYRTFARCAK